MQCHFQLKLTVHTKDLAIFSDGRCNPLVRLDWISHRRAQTPQFKAITNAIKDLFIYFLKKPSFWHIKELLELEGKLNSPTGYNPIYPKEIPRM